MAVKVAINGFGRIGRLVARAIFERTDHDLDFPGFDDGRHRHPGGPLDRRECGGQSGSIRLGRDPDHRPQRLRPHILLVQPHLHRVADDRDLGASPPIDDPGVDLLASTRGQHHSG